jgi:hypothetical protein
MLNLTELCYSILAPLSLLSQLLLIYSFFKLNQIKNHPEIMIFWQCISQIAIDVHWLTGIEAIKSSLTDEVCLFLGSFSVYFYYLSWDYNLFISIEILLKVRNPHEESYKGRKFWYHFLAHLSSSAVFITLMLSGTNGKSLLNTCFIEKETIYELVFVAPALFHFPLCMSLTFYTLYLSYGTHFKPYLFTHMLVVATFSVSWVSVALFHGISYLEGSKYPPEWFVYVKFK